MDLNGCVSLVQTYLQNNPLVILGSGASMNYGLPSMGSLATEICRHRENIEDEGFGEFYNLLDTGAGLEGAIDQASLGEEALNTIREITWGFVNQADFAFIQQHGLDISFAIAKLLDKIMQAAPNRVSVVTTNYDRIAEYAADIINATVITGFEGCLIRKPEMPSPTVLRKRIAARERIVHIWKVHGSLDWFVSGKGTVFSFPLSREIPMGFSPLIIPPGKDKYSKTHNEPYRTVIAQADSAFMGAGAYICVGYGFNDEHIQPKLLNEINKGKPIVILAKNMSSSCRHHIIESGAKKYLIFEEQGNRGTRVFGNGFSTTYDECLWNLDDFLNYW